MCATPSTSAVPARVLRASRNMYGALFPVLRTESYAGFSDPDLFLSRRRSAMRGRRLRKSTMYELSEYDPPPLPENSLPIL
jgi:hypothetical protein